MSDPLCSVERITSMGWRSDMRRSTLNDLAKRRHAGRGGTSKDRVGLNIVEVVLLVLLGIALVYAGYRAVAPGYRLAGDTQTIRVAGDQTLWELAAEYRVPGASTAETVEIIKSTNGMTHSSLRVGQTLQVPASNFEMTAMASR